MIRPLPIRALVAYLAPPVLAAVLAIGAGVLASGAERSADAAKAQLAVASAELPATGGAQTSTALVSGATPGLQAAALQALILSRAAATGVNVDRIEAKDPEPTGSLARLHAHASVSAPEADLMRLLIALEASSPLLFIDRLALTGDGEEGGTLNAEIDLSAYASAGGP